ncbi:MFS transporter [Egicoccus sp. AB-alg6-2]|uniref:MFS transporter n=1 Tax=Egicoccus sp. AB-alg6-2 TaxID=3242692 RepID=UPI00359DF2B2
MGQRGGTARSQADPARPRGLGANYRKLWTASTVSNLGDGIDSAAIPLLAEALTRNPMLFAGVAIAGRLPWLVFSLHAGVIADRVDRRRLMYLCNLVRFALMALLGTAIVLDVANVWLLYAVAVGLGTFEVLFDNAANALMPAVVRRDQLEKANGRLFAGEVVTNQFVGPALGAYLFGLAAALPILLDAGTFLVSAGLIFAMTGTYSRAHRRTTRLSVEAESLAPADGDQVATDPSVASPAGTISSPGRPRAVAEIREGLAWLRQHRLLRTFALLTAAMNGATMMGYSILALFVVGPESVLQLGQAAFGLLFVAGATGSLLGSFGAERTASLLGRGTALRAALLVVGLVPLAIGATGNVLVYLVAQAMYGFAAVTWNVITVSLRQRLVPDELLGRVNSVFRFLGWGAMPFGALVGGLTATAFGLRAPWFTAAAVMSVAIVLALPIVTPRAVAAADDEARATER